MVSLVKSKFQKTPVNSPFWLDFLKRSLMAISNSGIWISGISTMADMKFLSILNTGILIVTTLTLSSSLLKNLTLMNIPNLFTGQDIRKNILASNHRCIKAQNHLEPTTTEQFKKHHTSTQIPSPPSDSRMEESSKSEDAEDTINFLNLYAEINSRLVIF